MEENTHSLSHYLFSTYVSNASHQFLGARRQPRARQKDVGIVRHRFRMRVSRHLYEVATLADGHADAVVNTIVPTTQSRRNVVLLAKTVAHARVNK